MILNIVIKCKTYKLEIRPSQQQSDLIAENGYQFSPISLWQQIGLKLDDYVILDGDQICGEY